MSEFEALLGILLVAALLAAVARRVGAPYPAFLAVGGAVLAFVPGAPELMIDPEVALATRAVGRSPRRSTSSGGPGTP